VRFREFLSDDDDCGCDGGHKTRFSGQFKRQTLTFGLNALSQHVEVRLSESLDKSKGWRGGKGGKGKGRRSVPTHWPKTCFFRPATAFGHKQPA